MVASQSVVLSAADRLSHDEACRLCDLASRNTSQTIVVDLSRSLDASTAAFARLVLLRRDLLQEGRDLRLVGLSGRAAKLYEVHRLSSVLPRITELATPAPAPRPIVRPSVDRRNKLCSVA